MAASLGRIGTLQFDAMFGSVQDSSQETEALQRWGINGTDYRLGGKVAPVSEIRTTYTVHRKEAVRERKREEAALRGTAVQFVDQFGQVWPRVMVLGIAHERERAVVTMVGGAEDFGGESGYEIATTWSLQVSRHEAI